MQKRKKVIVVGGGFAGIHITKKLDKKYFEVLLVDKLNHHQFQPLFYQVATSQIEPASISFPLRNVFKNYSNVKIRICELTTVLPEQNKIVTTIGEFEYDYLVIATGCTTNFFGNDQISRHALTLKSTYEAINIRNHILQTFEDIISAPEDQKTALLNLVIVGAGATGVELAGAFAEIKENVLPKDYPDIDFAKFTITLIEGSPKTLSNMSELASRASRSYLEKMGVKIMTNTFVKNYNGQQLSLSSGEIMPARTVIWAAGVTGNKLPGLPEGSLGPGNRMMVDRINRVKGFSNIFAVGDIALMQTPRYPKGHPQVANVAINQSDRLAQNLKKIEKSGRPREFEYINLGSMATVGTNKAVVDLPFLRFKGYLAWLTWMFLHLMLILSVKNKLVIFLNWAWAYFTKDTSLRLILTPGKE